MSRSMLDLVNVVVPQLGSFWIITAHTDAIIAIVYGSKFLGLDGDLHQYHCTPK